MYEANLLLAVARILHVVAQVLDMIPIMIARILDTSTTPLVVTDLETRIWSLRSIY